MAAVSCADRGIHILAEKPMAADSAGIRLMIDAARRSGVVFSTPYVWRFHPVSIALRDLVRAGALGKIFGGQGLCAAGGAHRYVQGGAGWMLRKARSGGGAMHNLGVHWIDLFRWLLEDEVVEVTGRSIHFGVGHDVEDAALAFITFAGGAVLTLDVSYSVPDAFPGGREMLHRAARPQGLAHPGARRSRSGSRACSSAATRTGNRPDSRKWSISTLCNRDTQAGAAGHSSQTSSVRSGKGARRPSRARTDCALWRWSRQYTAPPKAEPRYAWIPTTIEWAPGLTASGSRRRARSPLHWIDRRFEANPGMQTGGTCAKIARVASGFLCCRKW